MLVHPSDLSGSCYHFTPILASGTPLFGKEVLYCHVVKLKLHFPELPPLHSSELGLTTREVVQNVEGKGRATAIVL